MNELQVKTLEIIPASIKFNYKELEDELNKNLAKYEGLTFTADDATECRKTIAELRKGKKSVDDYRIKTKKELSEPVTAFEDKCKELNSKFDEVINPLVSQNEAFEIKRKSEKRLLVQEVLDEAIEHHELDHERAEQLLIPNNYLTASKSIKSITTEVEANASHLKMQQDKELADKESVILAVKLANSENELSLSVPAYVRSLEFNDLEKVRSQIDVDVQQEIEKRERVAALEKERIKQEELAAEIVVKAPVEKNEDVPVENESKPVEKIFVPVIEDLPFSDIEEQTTEEYSIVATEEQHESVKQFLKENNIDWTTGMGLPF